MKEQDILERLATLLAKEEQDGLHVRANTVWLAIQEIERLRKKAKE